MDRFLRVADAPLRGLRRPLSARAAKPGHWPAPWARPRLRLSPGSRGRAAAAHASDLRFAGGRTPAPAAVRRPEAPKRWPAPGLAWTPRRARRPPAPRPPFDKGDATTEAEEPAATADAPTSPPL
ncbi:hypothetical protein FA387_30745, partial [Pseudomonas aeruginosa]|nr:hypothetical protein [Pseudomonas aeruginosa]